MYRQCSFAQLVDLDVNHPGPHKHTVGIDLAWITIHDEHIMSSMFTFLGVVHLVSLPVRKLGYM